MKFKCRETCAKYLPKLCGGETSFPSIAPTSFGSISMTSSSSPTEFCVDDDSFEFEIVTGEMKDCEWLSESDERINTYCNTKIVGKLFLLLEIYQMIHVLPSSNIKLLVIFHYFSTTLL